MANTCAQPAVLAEPEFIPTRASLLARIKDISHNESWREFFELYWKLIYNSARRKGLTDTESQEVVQETMIQLSKSLPDFSYDPARGSFKRWLMNLTSWKILDQLRKRQRLENIEEHVETLPGDFSKDWDDEWTKNLYAQAIEQARRKFSAKHFQIFTFCVLQNKGAKHTAQVLNVNTPSVHLITHRISKAIKNELQRLSEKEGI